MTGLLVRIREQPREVLDDIAKSMNVRASEPAMQTICARYMAQITLPEGARVLEVGCGNGAATKLIVTGLPSAANRPRNIREPANGNSRCSRSRRRMIARSASGTGRGR